MRARTVNFPRELKALCEQAMKDDRGTATSRFLEAWIASWEQCYHDVAHGLGAPSAASLLGTTPLLATALAEEPTALAGGRQSESQKSKY